MPLLNDAQLASTTELVLGRLREEFAPVAIYLFGSYAYGAPTRHSDLDLLVVVESSAQDVYERDARAHRALAGIRMSVDVQVYTRAEFESRAALAVSFERTVRTKGKLLYAA